MGRTSTGTVKCEELILLPADIFCTRGSGLVSRLIRLGSRTIGESRTRVNHVGIVVKEGTVMGASVVEALSTVQLHTLWSQYAESGDEVAVFRPRALLSSEKIRIATRALSYEGRQYGWLKIAAHAIDYCLLGAYAARRITCSDRYPICSWVVEHAYATAGLDFGVPLGSTQPDDIWDYCMGRRDEFDLVRPLRRLSA